MNCPPPQKKKKKKKNLNGSVGDGTAEGNYVKIADLTLEAKPADVLQSMATVYARVLILH